MAVCVCFTSAWSIAHNEKVCVIHKNSHLCDGKLHTPDFFAWCVYLGSVKQLAWSK